MELDPKQEILISPPLELGEDNRPTLRRRSLIIPLQGLELRDSVTYVVNVGSAIKDLNEGNPTENLRFVFATGPVLDSASVSGNIVRDYSGEPLESGTIALFSNLADTAVTTENPTYFAQTDEEGAFTVFNVRPGTYRAIALERNPSATNYFIDVAGFAQPLAIGFLDSLITVADGPNDIGTLQVSAVGKPLRINAADTTAFGRLKLVLNQPAENVDFTSGRSYLRQNVRDTLNLFYTAAAADTIVVYRDELPADTFVFSGNAAPPGPVPRLVKSPKANINPATGLVFVFDRPLESLDPELTTLRQDTLPDPVAYTWASDSLDPFRLRVDANWATGKPYALQALPGAVVDQTGGVTQDTVAKDFRVDSPEKYGIIRLEVTGLDTAAAYVLQLVEGDEVVDATRRAIVRDSVFSVEYLGLEPGDYTVEIIDDANANGRYDAGNFFTGRQPERVRRFVVEKLRANWEVEETVELDDI